MPLGAAWCAGCLVRRCAAICMPVACSHDNRDECGSDVEQEASAGPLSGQPSLAFAQRWAVPAGRPTSPPPPLRACM